MVEEKKEEDGGTVVPNVPELTVRLGRNGERVYDSTHASVRFDVLGVGTFIFVPYWRPLLASGAIPTRVVGEIQTALDGLGDLATRIESGRIRPVEGVAHV